MAQPSVALFVTCLVNSLRPGIGFACVKVLEGAGFRVGVPESQTCCGQPGYNNGLEQEAARVARHQIAVLEGYDFVVVPSGSCAGMISVHYPRLLADDSEWLSRAQALATRTYEFGAFLAAQGIHYRPLVDAPTTVHHTSCSCRRETRSHNQDDRLLTECLGEKLVPLAEQEVCCGFGGTFSAKFDAISARMGTDKLNAASTASAHQMVSADLGCLLHLQGLAQRQQRNLRFRHLAEILADAEREDS